MQSGITERKNFEESPASNSPPANLTAAETELYHHLLACESGRLEQEFLPASLVQPSIRNWAGGVEMFDSAFGEQAS